MPFDGESLMDNEPWMENGSMITIKEVKEEYPTLSLHLVGGQFKRKDLKTQVFSFDFKLH